MRTDKQPEKLDPMVDMGYETRDVDYKILGRWVAGFFVFTFLSIFVGYGLYYWWYKGGEIARESKPSAPRVTFPENTPPLQTSVSAKTDMMAIRQYETKTLTATEWVSREKGTVRIPIDRAIDLIASGQVPVATGKSVAAKTVGNTTDQVAGSAALDATPAAPPSSAAPGR